MGPNGKLIKVWVYDTDAGKDGKLGLRNEGTRTWDSQTNEMRFWEFDTFGGITTGKCGVDEGSLFYEYEYRMKSGVSILRNLWTKIDANAYRFQVGIWEDGKLKNTFLDVTFKRSPLSHQPAGNEGEQMDADVAQLKNVAREFVEGFNSRDVDRIMRFYADTYVDVNLRQPVQTKAERREYYGKILERRDAKVAVIPEEIIVHGEYAFVRGTILLTRTPPGGASPKQLELRYMEVARKFPDGWKAIWGMDAELYPDQEN